MGTCAHLRGGGGAGRLEARGRDQRGGERVPPKFTVELAPKFAPLSEIVKGPTGTEVGDVLHSCTGGCVTVMVTVPNFVRRRCWWLDGDRVGGGTAMAPGKARWWKPCRRWNCHRGRRSPTR